MTAQSRRAAWLVPAVALCIYVATAGGGLTSTDAVMTYEVTKSLVLHGSVAVPYNLKDMEQHQGTDQRYYAPFGIGQSIFNVPFYIAGQAARRWLGIRLGKEETLDKSAVAVGNTVAAAGIVWVAFLFAWRLSGSFIGASRTAFVLGFGTLIWPYSKFGFNAPITTLCLLAGIYAAWVGVRAAHLASSAWAGVWLACAFLTRHEMALAALLVAGWIAFESRGNRRQFVKRLACLSAPLAAALAFWLWYNFIRFGDPFNTGYIGDPVLGFDEPVLAGIGGLLLSPGRSLFLYAPVTVAGLFALPALARRDPSLTMLFAGLLVSFLVFYGSLPSWEGGRGYGPRYLVPLLPFLVIPMVYWLQPDGTRWRRVLLGAAVLSTVVQLPGVLVDFSKVSVAYARAGGGPSRDSRVYTWRESSLVLDTGALLTAVPENVRYLVRRERPAAAARPAAEDERDFAQRFDFSLDFWWLYLYYFGAISAPAAVAFGAMPLVAAWLVVKRILVLSRSSPATA